MEIDSCLVVFSHGMESSPASSKIQLLTKLAQDFGLKTIAPDYTSTFDPAVRLQILDKILQETEYNQLILVGSSMGSYVSLKFAEKYPDKIAAMFLMAPAVGIENYDCPEIEVKNVNILHGWQDELIPPEVVFNYAQKINAQLTFVKDSHRLANSKITMQNIFKIIIETKI